MRRKFLEEHTHAEDEVRFFVEGCGLFVLHIGSEVLSVLCVGSTTPRDGWRSTPAAASPSDFPGLTEGRSRHLDASPPLPCCAVAGSAHGNTHPCGCRRCCFGTRGPAPGCRGGAGPPHSRLSRHGQQRLQGGKGRLPRCQASQSLAISLQELGISRRVQTNPLVVAVSPRLQRLLDDSCALDPTKEAEALRLAENEL